MKKKYYTDLELVDIANNCRSLVELSKAKALIFYLYEEHLCNISPTGFNLLVLLRAKQLINVKGRL